MWARMQGTPGPLSAAEKGMSGLFRCVPLAA